MFEDSITTISDTLDSVSQQFSTPFVQSEMYELNESEIKKRKLIRIVVTLVILGSITAFIIYKIKK